MPWRAMNALAKSFELSSCAAARVGPKIRRPAARNASTIPAASGASGPTTVSPTWLSRAKATSSCSPSTATLVSSGSSAVPALPGATNTFATRGDAAIFHASACSRPPPPMTRTFTPPAGPPQGRERSELWGPSIEVDHAEDVEDAAVVDPAVERRDERRQQRHPLIAQRKERQ